MDVEATRPAASTAAPPAPAAGHHAKPHAVAPLRALLLPRARPLARRLLATPGLELTFHARGALLVTFREIASTRPGARVLVPAFHCPSAIAPVLLAGLEPVFYRIKPDLSIDTDDLQTKVGSGVAAVLVIHFFGVAPDLAALAPLRDAGVALVEDCSHSFVANPVRLAGDEASDYRIFSFWKTVPSGVGGALLRSPARGASATPTRHGQAPFVERLRNYKLLLEESIERSNHHTLRVGLDALDSLRTALRRPGAAAAPAAPPDPMRGEAYYPIDPAVACSAMPAHAVRIVESSDLEAVVARRRANHARFAAAGAALDGMVPLHPALPGNACPWVYPVLLAQRSQTDHRLRTAGVALHTFGIYLHSTLFASADARTVADARFLADNILCLAVHQDLEGTDIDRSIQTIQRELAQRRPT